MALRMRCVVLVALAGTIVGISSAHAVADGFVRGPAKYEGSLAESSQEAVIIVPNSPDDDMATEDLILKMKLTGLQHERFDVNLYVFYRYWLNDELNRFGYVKRGFSLKYRDWDGPHDRPNEGKRWAKPETDPFLRNAAKHIPTVGKLFAELHPNEKFYLTNIRADRLDPQEVKAWPDDLWLFPYYRDPHFIPYDARSGGPAEAGADAK